jgi:predicted nucleic acid-binding protein
VQLPLVVVDASVALKWFHAAGEDAIVPARAILEAFATRKVDLVILDLTIYEIGNVLLRRAGVGPQATATVLAALAEICQPVALSGSERATAARLARQHDLTFHEASYPAVALERGARLVTMSRALLEANLGVRPEDAFD